MLTEEAGKEKDPNWKLILAAATIFFFSFLDHRSQTKPVILPCLSKFG